MKVGDIVLEDDLDTIYSSNHLGVVTQINDKKDILIKEATVQDLALNKWKRNVSETDLRVVGQMDMDELEDITEG